MGSQLFPFSCTSLRGLRWLQKCISRRTSTDNSFDGVAVCGEISDSVGGKHVPGVRKAGDGRQFVAVEVRADADRHQSDAGVSDQRRLTQSGRLVCRRVVGDNDDQLGHRRVAETSAVRRHENRVAGERQGKVEIGIVAAVLDSTDCRLHLSRTTVVDEVEVDLRMVQCYKYNTIHFTCIPMCRTIGRKVCNAPLSNHNASWFFIDVGAL